MADSYLDEYQGVSLRTFRRSEGWLSGLRRQDWGEKKQALSALFTVSGLADVPLCDVVKDVGITMALAGAYPHASDTQKRYMIGALNRALWFSRVRARARAGADGIELQVGRIPSLRTPPHWVKGKIVADAASGLPMSALKARHWVSRAYIEEALGRGGVAVVDDVADAVSPATLEPPEIDELHPVAHLPARQLELVVDPLADLWDLPDVLRMIAVLSERAAKLCAGGQHHA